MAAKHAAVVASASAATRSFLFVYDARLLLELNEEKRHTKHTHALFYIYYVKDRRAGSPAWSDSESESRDAIFINVIILMMFVSM